MALTGAFVLPSAFAGVGSIGLGTLLLWSVRRRRRTNVLATTPMPMPMPTPLPRPVVVRPVRPSVFQRDWEVLGDLPESDGFFGVLADPPPTVATIAYHRPFGVLVG